MLNTMNIIDNHIIQVIFQTKKEFQKPTQLSRQPIQISELLMLLKLIVKGIICNFKGNSMICN